MLSVVVVGRNDSHGYNLSKRVATSLNSIALPMSGSDELIFVDWNTDDINPTFIDAIRDTLTEQTLKHLVVYRVRPSVHKKLANGIKRPILEPIARNVGIRRAKNPWILSTNTDMIFDTHGKKYSEIISTLKPNLYHLFRYEIPEYIWDQFNRREPEKTLAQVRNIFTSQGLVSKILTVPFQSYENLFPDAVGDFQLTTKEIWDSVKGFPEDMLKGWHVDSRLSVQIEKSNDVKSVILDSNLIEGFHQDHLRVLTHFHGNTTINPLEIIAEPYLNSDNWGLNALNLENSLHDIFTISNLNPNFANIEVFPIKEQVLQELLESPMYSLDLVRTFLIDDLVNLPSDSKVVISSANPNFAVDLSKQFSRCIRSNHNLNFINLNNIKTFGNADLIILDFGIADSLLKSTNHPQIVELFESTIVTNLHILENLPKNQRLVAIRAQHWAIRSLIHEYCSAPLFNNYPAILSGIVIGSQANSLTRIVRKIKNRIRKKFYMHYAVLSLTQDNRYIMREFLPNSKINWDSALSFGIVGFIFKIYKKFPFVIRNSLNPKIRKFLRIY